MDKALEKLFNSVTLVVLISGIVLIIIGAAKGLPIGNPPLAVNDMAWRIGLAIVGLMLVVFGLLFAASDVGAFTFKARVKTFEDIQSFLEYVNGRLQKAEVQIDDLSWRSEIGKSDDLSPVANEALKYHDLIKQTARRIAYREVFIFNRRDRIEKAYVLLADNANGYSCGYYDQITKPPLLSFMVVDKKEVLMLNVHDNSRCIAFQQPEIVDMFVKYYDDIWQQSKKMKHGKDIFWDSIEMALGKDKAEALKSLQTKVAI